MGQYNDRFLDDYGEQILKGIIELSYKDARGRITAVGMLDKLIEKYPNSPQLRVSYGIMLPTKRISSKMVHFKKAIELDKSFYDGYRRLSQCLQAQAIIIAEAPIEERINRIIELTTSNIAIDEIIEDSSLFTDDWNDKYEKSISVLKIGLKNINSSIPQELFISFKNELLLLETIKYGDERRKYFCFVHYIKLINQ